MQQHFFSPFPSVCVWGADAGGRGGLFFIPRGASWLYNLHLRLLSKEAVFKPKTDPSEVLASLSLLYLVFCTGERGKIML